MALQALVPFGEAAGMHAMPSTRVVQTHMLRAARAILELEERTHITTPTPNVRTSGQIAIVATLASVGMENVDRGTRGGEQGKSASHRWKTALIN